MSIFEEWLSKVTFDEREELERIKDDPVQIRERFGGELGFGTAGMRGIIRLGTFGMNVYTVKRATKGVADYLSGLDGAKDRGVVIAYDTRRFSREFAAASAGILAANGIKVYLFEDVRPVPVCSFAVRRLNAEAGIMITASHNPKEYNGYKVYGPDGAQMSPEATAKVVEFIQKTPYFGLECADIPTDFREGDVFGTVKVIGKDLDEEYFAEIEKILLSPEIVAERGKDIKLVYTPVHGAGYMPVTTMFARLGIQANVVAEQVAPDPDFSTVKVPNPENKETLSMGIELGKKIGADVVLGTDPDSDRLGVALRLDDGEYVPLTGNQIGVLLMDYIITRKAETGALKPNAAVVKTIVTTTLADRICKKRGVTVFNVLTGFKFIGEKIKEWEASGEYEYIFGFEESFGSLAGTYARDKDAVAAAVLFAEMMLYLESRSSGVYKRLKELYSEFGYYVEKNASVEYGGLDAMRDMAAVMEKLRGIKVESIGGEKVLCVKDYLSGKTLSADGTEGVTGLPVSDVMYYRLPDEQFVVFRPSGTEPKLKIYTLVFDKNDAAATAKAERIMKAAKELLK